MNKYLPLYKPYKNIALNSSLKELKKSLDEYGFKLTTYIDRPPIYHGNVWISEKDKITIHFYFEDKTERIKSIMIHSCKAFEGDTLIQSYQRKQNWLESLYGKANKSIDNSFYGVKDYIWELKDYDIKHFIQDRFGDEEGLYFNIKL